jgi:hypothetical protein
MDYIRAVFACEKCLSQAVSVMIRVLENKKEN